MLTHSFCLCLQVEVQDDKPLCPGAGYYPFVDEECGPAFVKCEQRAGTDKLQGTVYKCPRGYSFWSVSRRCEKTEKLPNCRSTRLNYSNGIPIEWINLGKARHLRI